jgi:hypothetical protein
MGPGAGRVINARTMNEVRHIAREFGNLGADGMIILK